MKHIRTISPRVVLAASETESPIEVILFHALMRTPPFVLCQQEDTPSGEGYFLFPQHQVGPYRADFIIRGIGYPAMGRVWPPRLQSTIAVECDGRLYHSTPEQIKYDKERDAFFNESSIKTLRFTGSNIYRNVDACVQEIAHHLDLEMKRARSPSHDR